MEGDRGVVFRGQEVIQQVMALVAVKKRVSLAIMSPASLAGPSCRKLGLLCTNE